MAGSQQERREGAGVDERGAAIGRGDHALTADAVRAEDHHVRVGRVVFDRGLVVAGGAVERTFAHDRRCFRQRISGPDPLRRRVLGIGMGVDAKPLGLDHAIAHQATETEVELLVELARVMLVEREALRRHFLALLRLEERRHAADERIIRGNHGNIFEPHLVIAVVPGTEVLQCGVVDALVDTARLVDDDVVWFRFLRRHRQQDRAQQQQHAAPKLGLHGFPQCTPTDSECREL